MINQLLHKLFTNKGWAITFLCLLAIPSFFWGSSFLPLSGPDEATYTAVTLSMMQYGDYITPRLGDAIWLEKPALINWLLSGSFHLFGVSEFAARLPITLLSLLTVLLIAHTGWKLISPTVGLLSGIVLSTTGAFIVFSKGATTDMPLTASLTLSMCAFLFADRLWENGTSTKRHLWLALFYLGLGLTSLAKGLTGLVLASIILLTYLILTNRFKSFFGWHLLWGSAIIVGIAATWYLPMYLRHGMQFIDEFFLQHHFARYTSNRYHHPGPVYYYLLALVPLLLPWSFLLSTSFSKERLKKYWKERKDTQHQAILFALCWFAAPVIFFSFSSSKLASYILPVIPAAALVAGHELQSFLQRTASKAKWRSLSAAGVLLLLLGLIVQFIPVDQAIPELVLLVIAAGSAIWLFISVRSRWQYTVLIPALGMSLLTIPLTYVLESFLAKSDSFRPLASVAKQERKKNEPFYFIGDLDRRIRTFTFYTDPALVYDERYRGLSISQAVEAAIQHESILCVVPSSSLDSLKNYPISFARLDGQKNTELVRLYRSN